MILNWLTSKTVREANALYKHVHKLLQHQRDILSANAINEIAAPMRDLRAAMAAKPDKATLTAKMDALATAADKWLKPYPNAAWRENFEVMLVALAVAMGIRTFFVQPFKIPTASMQPTLFGITSKNLLVEKNYQRPTGMGAVKDWLGGATYLTLKADQDGTFDGVSKPLRLLIFNIKQTVWFGGKPHNFWFVPDTGGGMPLQLGLAQTLQAMFGNLPAVANGDISDLEKDMRIARGTVFHPGEDILKMKIIAGDHLFIDRISYNFVTPRRGDIVVFETKGIPEDMREANGVRADDFYIKRLVGLGGDTISLKQDYLITDVSGVGLELMDIPAGHLVVNGQPITKTTPHFENLYSFPDAAPGTQTIPYIPDHYYGHSKMPGKYLSGESQFHVQPDRLFVMGDNTMRSLDSRFWGDFPKTAVIGKAFFIYWPINDRFGLSYH